MLTRRQLFTYGFRTMLGAGVAAGFYAWRIEPHWLEFTHREMAVPNLPAELEGTTLVQISDTHVGEVDEDYLTTSFRNIAAFEPDWIVFTGDFMSCRGPEHIDAATRVFESLPPARLGRAAIFGNHDYGRHYGMINVADGLGQKLRNLGMEVLSNESKSFGGLTITGLDDMWGPRFAPRPALERIDPAKANLVLVHNPDVCDLPIWGNYRGWILSGHTHGGQCKPPFLPPPILPVRNPRYTCGQFDVGPGRTLYINRALGYLRRLRFNVRPEITVFRLRSGFEV